MRLIVLWAVLLWAGCATTEEAGVAARWEAGSSAEECAAADEEACVSVACDGDGCGLYRCGDLASAPLAFRGAMAPTAGSAPHRFWGAQQPLPGRSPVFVIKWERPEELPSQKRLRTLYREWEKAPKEKHHIFPRALEGYFASRGINIHEYALAIDVKRHREIHDGVNGGPWNDDWRAFIRTADRPGKPARKWQLFDQAGYMVQKYQLVGMPMSYWQQLSTMMTPVEGR
ncbi:TIGR02269 family lipoprotein [Myxococcus stipitatus]|uniref:SitA6 family polymorphic toxin lipoprotein n=1 Tax=Myxococcus stipitatus TaxID=83455 RepID=UPI0031454782